MIGQRSQLINFVDKFLGTVRFGNDQIAKIMRYGDYQIGNVIISKVYYVEGFGHNLFLVGQFCDSDLEVAFRKHTYFVHNLEGVDLLKGFRDTNLYTLSLDDMVQSSPICLLFKGSKTKSWLWYRRLSHLNFCPINELAKQGLVRGLPTLKYKKDHFCSACSLGKIKKHTHKPKFEDSIQEKLYLLHMDLCGPMRIESINEKKYILVIVDDYSRFTWAEAVATACYTQNRSLIRKRHNKTPYELLHDKKPDLKYLHVFGALCYPTNDNEDLEPSSQESSSNVQPANPPFEHLSKWTKNHPLENLIGNPSRPVSTRCQIQTDDMWCFLNAFLTSVEPKNFKEALLESSWIDAMKEEIHEFERLQVWELILRTNMGTIDINTLTIEQYLSLTRRDRPGVVMPELKNDVDFEIKSQFMSELRCNLFAGTDDEDPHEHMQRVLEITNLFHIPGVTRDAVMLRVFHTTLTGAARRWKNMLPAGCPQHDLNNHQKVQIFYNGLDIPSRKMVDSQGLIPMMPPAEALKSIQNMADHSQNYFGRDMRKLKESINAIYVGCKNCEEVHLTKECPLNENGKEVEHERAEQLTQEILTNNMVDNAKTKMRKDIEVRKEPVPFHLPNVNPYVEPIVPRVPFPRHLKDQEDEAQAFRMLEGLKMLKINRYLIHDVKRMPEYLMETQKEKLELLLTSDP
ncbi:retrovirus-related pol polyprotein from transposon TNT 1-94 [Tanacetum coccineum]|uniref:Retrovirus-related pol polyprotein from transposon TNT 1-94 n=1 Tax=Tanacetum coccineum TaxID=301880 RepID=A0ABQ5HBP2_9ASTR